MATGDTTQAGSNRKQGQRMEEEVHDVFLALGNRSKDDLLQVIEALKDKYKKLKHDLEATIKERQDLKTTMTSYDGKLAKLKDKIYRLQDEIDEREEQIDELKNKLKKIKQKYHPDGAAGSTKPSQDEDKGSDDNELIDRKKQEELDKERDEEFQKIMNDMTTEAELLQDRIKDLEEMLQDRDDALDDADRTVKEQENTIKELNGLITELQEKLEKEEEEEEFNNNKSIRIDKLTQTVAEKEEVISQLVNEKEKFLKRIGDLERCLMEQDVELPVDDIDGVNPRSANSALRILKTQYLRLRNEHSACLKENSQLQEENDRLKLQDFSDKEGTVSNSCLSPRNDCRSSSKLVNRGLLEQLRDHYEKQVHDLHEELLQCRQDMSNANIINEQWAKDRDNMKTYMNMLQVCNNTNAELVKKNNNLTRNLAVITKERADLKQELEAAASKSEKPRIFSQKQSANIYHPATSEAGSQTTSVFVTKTIPDNDVPRNPEPIIIQQNVELIDLLKNGMNMNIVQGELVFRANDHQNGQREIVVKIDTSAAREIVKDDSDKVSENNKEPNTKIPFISPENYDEIIKAFQMLKTSAEELDFMNQHLYKEITDNRQRYESQLHVAKMEQERIGLIFMSDKEKLAREMEKLSRDIQEERVNYQNLVVSYQDQMKLIESDNDRLQEEVVKLQDEVKEVQDKAASDQETLNETISNGYQERAFLEKKYQKLLCDRDSQVHDLCSVNSKQSTEIEDLKMKVCNGENEISQLYKNLQTALNKSLQDELDEEKRRKKAGEVTADRLLAAPDNTERHRRRSSRPRQAWNDHKTKKPPEPKSKSTHYLSPDEEFKYYSPIPARFHSRTR